MYSVFGIDEPPLPSAMPCRIAPRLAYSTQPVVEERPTIREQSAESPAVAGKIGI